MKQLLTLVLFIIASVANAQIDDAAYKNSTSSRKSMIDQPLRLQILKQAQFQQEI